MMTEYGPGLLYPIQLSTSHSREGIFLSEPYVIAEHYQPSSYIL